MMRQLLSRLIIGKLGAIAVSVAGLVMVAAPVLAQPEFTVRGTKILDPSGNWFIPDGTNSPGPNAVWDFHTTRYVDNIVNCWKFNTLRVSVHAGSDAAKSDGTPAHRYANDSIDDIIRTYTTRGVVVIVAFDEVMQNGNPPEQLYRHLLQKYKANSYVWFDLYNEPGPRVPTTQDLEHWTQYYRRLIHIARDQIKARNILVIQGTSWGQEGVAWNANPVPEDKSLILSRGAKIRDGYSNIVFSIHVYDQWNYGNQKLANYLDRVAAKGYALLVSEFGPSNGRASSSKAVESLMQVGPIKHIGLVNFGYPGMDGNALVASPPTGDKRAGGWAINSCTTPANLTKFGRLVWSYSHNGR